MLKIRFQRAGKKHDAFYRIVVCEHTSPIKWKFLEKVWSFSARKKEWTLNFNKERISHWISVWAAPSATVARLLVKNWLKEAKNLITFSFGDEGLQSVWYYCFDKRSLNSETGEMSVYSFSQDNWDFEALEICDTGNFSNNTNYSSQNNYSFDKHISELINEQIDFLLD